MDKCDQNYHACRIAPQTAGDCQNGGPCKVCANKLAHCQAAPPAVCEDPVLPTAPTTPAPRLCHECPQCIVANDSMLQNCLAGKPGYTCNGGLSPTDPLCIQWCNDRHAQRLDGPRFGDTTGIDGC